LSKCPLESSVTKNECIIAGLAVGGVLQNNELVESASEDKPSGCIIAEGGKVIHFNSNPVGARDDGYVSVCQRIEVRYSSILVQLHDIFRQL
jgi:hypothetical protein